MYDEERLYSLDYKDEGNLDLDQAASTVLVTTAANEIPFNGTVHALRGRITEVVAAETTAGVVGVERQVGGAGAWTEIGTVTFADGEALDSWFCKPFTAVAGQSLEVRPGDLVRLTINTQIAGAAPTGQFIGEIWLTATRRGTGT